MASGRGLALAKAILWKLMKEMEFLWRTVTEVTLRKPALVEVMMGMGPL